MGSAGRLRPGVGPFEGAVLGGHGARAALKRALGAVRSRRTAHGLTVLTYHRVGGGSRDELDLDPVAFARQLDALDSVDVITLDEAADRLEHRDRRPGVVLTFDDGFADVYEHAWPLLRRRRTPFTLFLATRYIGGEMRWEGSTAKAHGAALSWDQVREFVDSGLCTVGNHTHSHVPPERLTPAELDACSDEIEHRLGVRPQHFAYPWGIPVASVEDALRRRFRTSSTGQVGRNLPGNDLVRLRRVPVRRTDPIEFFQAKLTGSLVPERTYGALVTTAKRAGARA